MNSWYWRHSYWKNLHVQLLHRSKQRQMRKTTQILTLIYFRKNRISTAPFYLNIYKTEVLCVKDVMIIAWFVVQFKATSFCFSYPGKAHISQSLCTYHNSRGHTNSLTQIAETSTSSRGLSKHKTQKKDSKMSGNTNCRVILSSNMASKAQDGNKSSILNLCLVLRKPLTMIQGWLKGHVTVINIEFTIWLLMRRMCWKKTLRKENGESHM